MLLLRARSRLCILPLTTLGEVMRPLPLARLPDMPPFLLGVSRIRGKAVPVADLGLLIGLSEEPAFSRYLTMGTGDDVVALAVEAVIGIRRMDPTKLRSLPRLLRDSGRDVITALGTLDAELLSRLEFGRSLTDRMLASVHTGAAS